ncbi:MAG: NAD(P)/FAD-dependent oxidoreductase [Burkholderiales bacterium]|nr:NAD(P)/FAD-dependent oxidoreductase [Burkholderiales bacterium]
MERIDTAVVGAGVVGLAIARALAGAGQEVVVLESEDAFGTGISARNSEVIHAGIYYPTGSLRAALCVRGKQLLYDFCERHGVAHRRCAKLIVATEPGELPVLARLQQQAAANGVHDLQPLSAAEARALEPALQCQGALLSPSTGIIDSHGLMLALLGEAESHGAMLALRSPVRGGRVTAEGIVLEVGGEVASTLCARRVVNAAGLGAPALAAALQGLAAQQVPRLHLSKGCYFTLPGKAPFSRLVYPAPGEAGHLGVHLTLDLGGQARFGPSFRWVDSIDYQVDMAEAEAFYAEVRRYWPGLADGALQPGYAGMRPKISGPGQPQADFRIDGPAVHGVPGLVNLFGIESPGLTASLAIAERVASLLA